MKKYIRIGGDNIEKYIDAYKISAKRVLIGKIKHMHRIYNIIEQTIGRDNINFCFLQIY